MTGEPIQMSMIGERPLVSLCMTCYNQARFIREAVQSAFDQTYDPLEIIISDDHSTDGTDGIVEKMVADYLASGGQHSVTFLRNERNLNVLKNYEQAFMKARGVLVVTGSGDDVSLPDRVNRIVSAWMADGGRATVIHHGCECIDARGRHLWSQKAREPTIPLGACTAYRRDVFSAFPSPTHVIAMEDMVFATRAYMLGDAVLMNDALVRYRIGGMTTGSLFDRRKLRRSFQGGYDSFRQLDDDFAFAEGRLPAARIETIKAAYRDREAKLDVIAPFVFADSFGERYRALRLQEGRIPWFGRRFFEQTLFILPDWLSHPIALIYEFCLKCESLTVRCLADHGFHPKRFFRKLMRHPGTTTAAGETADSGVNHSGEV